MEPPLAQPPKESPDEQSSNKGSVSAAPATPAAPGMDQPLGSTPLTQAPKVETNDHEGLRSILTTLAILILAPLIALALTAFIFQSYQVDGSSMETTLQNADRLIVLKLPRTWAKITGHSYVPHRGDVIIFNKNDLAQYGDVNQKKQLVKRVIGLPGDHVIIKDGAIKIINAEHPDGFYPDKTLPYGKVIPYTAGGNDADVIVQPGYIFVCGDNRGNSLDSRIFGPISTNDIVGKLVFRIFPFNKAKKF